MLKNRLLKGVGANGINNAAMLALQLLTVPVLVTRWGQETYGIWVMLSALPALLAFSDMGFATAAGTSMAMDVASGRREEAARTYASTLRAMQAIGGAIIAIVAAVLWLAPSRWFEGVNDLSPFDVRLTVFLLAVYGVACLQNTISFAGFRSDGLMHVGTLTHTAIYSVENLAMIGAAMAGGSPVWAASALAVGRIGGVVVQSNLLRRMLPWLGATRGLADWGCVRSLLGPASAAMVLPAAQALLLQGSAVTLGAAVSAVAVPIFSVTRTLSRVGLQATQMVATAVMPEFSAAAARGEQHIKAKLMAFSAVTCAAMAVPFCVLLAIFGREVVGVWTRGEIDPGRALPAIMALAVFLGALWTTASRMLMALNRQDSFAYAFLGLALASVPAGYLLAGWTGPIGSGITLLAVDLLMTALILRRVSLMGVTVREIAEAMPFLMARVRGLVWNDRK